MRYISIERMSHHQIDQIGLEHMSPAFFFGNQAMLDPQSWPQSMVLEYVSTCAPHLSPKCR